MLYSSKEIEKIINHLHQRILQTDDPEIKSIYSDLTSLAQTTQLQISELYSMLTITTPETRLTETPTDKKDT